MELEIVLEAGFNYSIVKLRIDSFTGHGDDVDKLLDQVYEAAKSQIRAQMPTENGVSRD